MAEKDEAVAEDDGGGLRGREGKEMGREGGGGRGGGEVREEVLEGKEEEGS